MQGSYATTLAWWLLCAGCLGRDGVGGAEEDRTPDLLLARQVLSRLSYGPFAPLGLVGPGGFEPPTSPLSEVRSNQLSYGPGNAPSSCGWPASRQLRPDARHKK